MKRPRQLWPDGSGCKSCGTRRRYHKFLGYCTRCYPIIYRISRIDRGLYRPRGRRPYPDSFLPRIRKGAVAELEEIRELEAPVRDGATGIDIENLLVAIAQNTRAKPEKLDGARYFFDDCLNVEQRTRTYTVTTGACRKPAWPTISARTLYAQASSGSRKCRVEGQA